ncbi:MAG: Ig-like domain-containing protein, partial [Clostridium sp.]|nr:Ig-like domain-containing protein [Clostridium sp.]
MQGDVESKKICRWMLIAFILWIGCSANVQAAGRTVIKVNGMNIKQTTSLKSIEKKFGKARIVTESMYGGKAYSFYKGDYKNYLYLESNEDGKWVGAGSVGTKFATENYKSGKHCNSTVHVGTDIYDDSYAVKAATKAGIVYGAVEYLDDAEYSKAQKKYCKSIACRIGVAKHATSVRNAVWSYRGQKERLEFDEDGFIVADQIIQKAGISAYDYTENAGKSDYVDLHGCGRIMLAHMDPFHLADEGKEYNVEEQYPFSLMIYYYARGKYCYEDSCYGVEFVNDFINDKYVTKTPEAVRNAIVETTRLNNKKSTTITLKAGKSEQLTIPKTKKKVRWTSSNKKIVKVNKKGKITALRKGSATITAKTGKKRYVCKVKVTKKNEKNVQFVKSTVLKTGESVTLKIPGDQKGSGWSIADKKIAKVMSYTGSSVTIYGLSSGTTTLRVKIGSTIRECVVTVNEKYSYQIIPLLPPFNNYFYLKTEDPDPYDLVFMDVESRYLPSGVEADRITPVQESYQDVRYTDKNYYRVNGGYICRSEGYTDGGMLKMQRRLLRNQSGQYVPYEWNKSYTRYAISENVDTVVQVNCETVTTAM